MSEHTPGPWQDVPPAKARGDEAKDVAIAAIVDGKRSVIAECFWRVGDSHYAPSAHNARLIAAAPDLLAALWCAKRTLYAWHQIGMADDEAWLIYNSDSPEMKQINAALDKARGINAPASAEPGGAAPDPVGR